MQTRKCDDVIGISNKSTWNKPDDLCESSVEVLRSVARHEQHSNHCTVMHDFCTEIQQSRPVYHFRPTITGVATLVVYRMCSHNYYKIQLITSLSSAVLVA